MISPVYQLQATRHLTNFEVSIPHEGDALTSLVAGTVAVVAFIRSAVEETRNTIRSTVYPQCYCFETPRSKQPEREEQRHAQLRAQASTHR